MNVQSGELGMAYIRKYCLLHFELVILLAASNEAEFAKQLYRILVARGKRVVYLKYSPYICSILRIVRTKSDIDVLGLAPAEKEAKYAQIKKGSIISKLTAYCEIFLDKRWQNLFEPRRTKYTCPKTHILTQVNFFEFGSLTFNN